MKTIIVASILAFAGISALAWWAAKERSVIRVTPIDGCEYVEVGLRGSRGYTIIHKGDCRNPVHGAN